MTTMLPQLPGGPSSAEPVPRTPVAGFDLSRYARVAAELAENAEPRATVLARAELDEVRWLEIEQTWLLRIATAALQGDVALLQEYDAALTAAQADSAAAAPTLSIEAYARVVAAIENGAAPARVLAEAEISVAAFARGHRTWTAKLSVDDALASSFRATVEQLRRHPDGQDAGR